MKKLLIAGCAALLVLASCTGPLAPPDDPVTSVAEMEEGAEETLRLLMEASMTGDRSELDAFLAANDPTGELTAIADEVLAPPAVPRSLEGFDPPPFNDPIYGDGDVLVFKGSESLTAQLVDLIFINAYGHAGIVDRAMVESATELTPNTPVVLSSTVPGGVQYQTWEELYLTNDTWTLLSVPAVVPGATLEPGWGETFSAVYNEETTMYSFLHLNFTPVSREESFWWYCSKVPYRIWRDLSAFPYTGLIELEYADLYELDDPDGAWTFQRSSILYQVYTCWYTMLPRYLRRYARTPDQVLKEALAELVTPDELRAAFGLHPKALWGDYAPEELLAQFVAP